MNGHRVIRRVMAPRLLLTLMDAGLQLRRDDGGVTGLRIRLLGTPEVAIDGVPQPPARGAKPWALLAYLALAEGPRPRRDLAGLLFGEAEDPLGALRWNLAALRRLLGHDHLFKGDPVTFALPVGSSVDVCDLNIASGPDMVSAPGDLLAGLDFPDSPAFETWLLTQRRRASVLVASRMREAALVRLGRGDLETAIQIAAELVVTDELDEGHHALLIRALAMAGDADRARGQFERCRKLLGDQLGVEPGSAVVAALHATPPRPNGDPKAPRGEIEARLAVSWQSFLGGAIDHGIDLARGVVSLADRSGEQDLRVVARMYLGAMLGMAVRGWDEAAAALNQALTMAGPAGLNSEHATIRGVLAGNDMMRADYDAARRHLAEGIAVSASPDARAVTTTFLAAVEADQDDLDAAARHAAEAVRHAADAADPVRRIYACCHSARISLMSGEYAEADGLVRRALEDAAEMPALKPWPLAMKSELLSIAADPAGAMYAAQVALATASVTGIAWQQALALRSIGVAEAAGGNPDAARDALVDALDRARSTTGEGYTFHWPVAFVLDSLSTTVRDGDDRARWAQALLDHTEPIGMETLARRACTRLATDPSLDDRDARDHLSTRHSLP